MQTNGTGNGLPPNINDMWNAVQRLKNMSPTPPCEFKLHPDDYAELKRQAAPYLQHPMPGVPDSFSGLRIVVDATAERLPRKTPSNAVVTGLAPGKEIEK
jgi:hypothetical protein